MYNETLCTVADAIQEIVTQQVSITAADTADILQAIRAASARIDEYLGVPFEPVIATRRFDATYYPVTADGQVLMLNWPLLDAETITLGNGTELGATDYQLDPEHGTAATEVYLTTGQHSFFSTDGTTPIGAIQIEGVWGMRRGYDRAWTSVTTLSAGINASVTAVPVTSATTISPGALLKVNSEYMRVTSITTNTLTVIRGENGSTAAAHLSADAVSVWKWEPVINAAAYKLAAYLYHRRGNFQQSQFDMGTGVAVQYPSDMPGFIAKTLDAYWVPV